MSDEAPKTTAVAVQQVREIRVVEDDVAVFSTANFEHMGRIAVVIAESGMMHDTLRGYYEGTGDNKTFVELPAQVQKARAFMIVELADRLSFSPFGLMGACSFVHGKLMLEGKVVNAAIQRKLGIDLDFLFGAWDAKTERTILKWTTDEEGRRVVDPEGEGQGDLLGVVVRGKLPSGEVREVHGSVGIWKTTRNNSPWRAGSMKRQLSYRGAREWERRHKPGLTLGVTFDDEWDGDLTEQRPRAPQGRVKADLAAKLAAPSEDAREGFSAAHVAQQTGGGQAVDAEVEETVVEGEAVGAEAMDIAEPCGECGAAEGVECEPGCSSWDELPELPEHIAVARAAAQQTHDPETGEVIEEGDAQADDGFPGDKPTTASERTVEQLHETQSGGTGDTEERTEPAGAINAFWTDVAPMTSWLSVKARIGDLYKSDDWNEMEPPEQAAERGKIWRFVDSVIKAKHKDPVDFAQDATAFRLWMETQTDAEGPDAVEGSLRVLKQAPAFTRQRDGFRKGFVDTVEEWIKVRRGKKR